MNFGEGKVFLKSLKGISHFKFHLNEPLYAHEMQNSSYDSHSFGDVKVKAMMKSA